MMESMHRRLAALLVSLVVGLASAPAAAQEVLTEQEASNRPSASAMLLDAVLARPALLVLTAAGTAIFAASLPFSALGGNLAEAGKTLVVGPAKSTFWRCLGCTQAQAEWHQQEHAEVPTTNY